MICAGCGAENRDGARYDARSALAHAREVAARRGSALLVAHVDELLAELDARA